MLAEILRVDKALEAARFEILDSHPGSFAQRLEPGPIIGLTHLDQAKAMPQNLAGVLIAARLYEAVDEIRLMISDDDVSSRHSCSPHKPLSQLGIGLHRAIVTGQQSD
jgi:hypothetical protein